MRNTYRAFDEAENAEQSNADVARGIWENAAQSQGNPADSGAIPRAMSWLVTCVVEGFAAYAEGMYPCFTDRGEEITSQAQAPKRRTPVPSPLVTQPWSYQDEVPAQFSPVAARVRDNRLTFRITRLLSRMRLGRSKRAPVIVLEALDDRLLRDMGVRRQRAESFADEMEPDRW